VRDESHLDDMRAAIRGDFQRLEERGVEQELMRLEAEAEEAAEPSEAAEPAPALDEPDPDRQPSPVAERKPVPEPVPASEPEMPPEPRPEPDPDEGAEAHGGGDHEVEDELPPRRSWLDRLLGR
jgi:hypothetical protein